MSADGEVGVDTVLSQIGGEGGEAIDIELKDKREADDERVE